MPSLIANVTIALTTILGYSAMAGIIGGGGLGQIAINYGYYRYKYLIMVVATALLVIMVQVFQTLGTWLAAQCDKRLRQWTCAKAKNKKRKQGPALLRIQKGGACRLWCHRRLSSFKISLKSPESTRRAPAHRPAPPLHDQRGEQHDGQNRRFGPKQGRVKAAGLQHERDNQRC